MPKFCEDCPLRGQATGELVTTGFMPIAIGNTDILSGGRNTTRIFRAGVVIDSDRNPSEPIEKRIETNDSIMAKIDSCEGVIEEEVHRLFHSPKVVQRCPVLGKLAIKRVSETYRIVAREVGI